MSPRVWWLVVAGSVALIAAATLLPFGGTAAASLPPRWCLACGGFWAADGISNMVLFLPLGLALAGVSLGAAPSLAAGCLLSFAVELAQANGFPPGRSPAIADVLTNSAGTALGWLMFTTGPRVLWARERRAATWAVGWLAAAAALWLLTALAEVRGGDANSNALGSAVTRSRYEYSPGYGWYGGMPLSAQVRVPAITPDVAHDSASALEVAPSWTLLHTGTGPIVAMSNAPHTALAVSVQVAGRDSATIRRALFYLHGQHDSTAELVVAQHDQAAELLVRRRANTWGLAMPIVQLPNVFAPGALDTLRLDAAVSGARLSLRATHAGTVRDAVLMLTPALGWSMLQTLVPVESRLAPLVQALWLALLVAPIGWFSGRAGGRVPVVTAAGVIAAFAAAAALVGVSAPQLADWGTVALSWLLGLALARLVLRRATSANSAGIIGI